MNEVTIYHNPRCSKSRQTLQLLKDHGVSPVVVLYLEDKPSSEAIKAILKKLDLAARQLLRKGEEAYKEHNLADQNLDDAAIIAAMVASPKLIERPIVVKGQKAILGRPPENVLELI